MRPTVSVIIVTWNGLNLLRRFLSSVARSGYPALEILIADNASEDGTREWVERNFPQCRVIRFHDNFGYCGGNNRAAGYASGEILVFLNNDVEVVPGWLSPLVEELSEPDVAAVQPKIRSHRNPDNFEYAGAAGGYLDQLAYPFCRGRVFDSVEVDNGQYDEPVNIFWASGAAFAIRKDLFLAIGGFDESFRFHMEEVDLCWRLLNRGHRIRCRPDSTVYHLGGGSLSTNDPKKTYYNFRNSLLMIWKNASTSWLKRNFLFRLVLDGAAGLHALLKGHFRDLWAIVRAQFSFYVNWSKVHRQRASLGSKKLSGEPSVMIRTSIVSNYFFSGRRTYSEVMNWLDRSGRGRKNSDKES